VHLPIEKLPYLALEEEVVWSAYNHTVSVPDQEDASGWYIHIGENLKKKRNRLERPTNSMRIVGTPNDIREGQSI